MSRQGRPVDPWPRTGIDDLNVSDECSWEINTPFRKGIISRQGRPVKIVKILVWPLLGAFLIPQVPSVAVISAKKQAMVFDLFDVGLYLLTGLNQNVKPIAVGD
jgi:hypothetical protein